MTARQTVEAEIRDTLAEMIGAARIVSEGTRTPRVAMRRLALEPEKLARLSRLIDQLR